MAARCGKRTAWLTVYFVLLLLGFTLCLLAVVTPSWQYVILEEGRTEHHHGLWLDCKRDYSNDYGRPREYYESLFRLDHLQTPFDQFSLPPLMCVYKFDYWLDDEDWYEHGYDENRLQDDAYQHLFIGWKIAALTSFAVSLVGSLSSLIIGTCAFCHRILVCVSAVLSSLTCLGGTAIYYMFANYQDNNIIKEEDRIYEQVFGWSFYTVLLANAFMITGSVIGCVATSVALSFGKAKLVNENDSDQLLLSGSDQPFKRSFSAIYKIDSAALRKWEREQMRSIRQRANSVPNFRRSQASFQSPVFMHSNSDISKAVTEPIPQSILVKKKPLLPPSNFQRARSFSSTLPPHQSTPAQAQETDLDQFPGHDGPIYEYVDHHSISVNSTIKLDTLDRQASDLSEPKTSLNVYDKVHSSRSPSEVGGAILTADDNEYLKPKRTSASSLIPANNVPQVPKDRHLELLEREIYERQLREKQTTSFGARKPKEEKMTRFSDEPQLLHKINEVKPSVPLKPPKITFFSDEPKQASVRSSPLAPSSSNNDEVCINTFQPNGFPRTPKGSITNLAAIKSSLPITEVFERSEPSETMSSLNGSFATPTRKTVGLKETNFDVISTNSSVRYVPSEMDRSLGSTTTFLPVSPSRRAYDLDDESSNTSSYASHSSRKPLTTSNNKDGETFV